MVPNKKGTKRAMFLQRLQLQMAVVVIIILLLLLAAVPAPASAQAKQGCRESCGNLTNIPYPFGTTPDCYYSKTFLITCNRTAAGQFQPFLREGDIPVTNISLDGQLYILNYVAQDCYNRQTGEKVEDDWASLTLKEFVVSDTKNKFTAIGCDTYAYVRGNRGRNTYGTGCVSICSSVDNVQNGTCSGVGCCQMAIPNGVLTANITLSSYYNHTDVMDFNPCSYAFIVQEDKFNFSTAYLERMEDIRLPLVLDWAIGNESCEVGKRNSTSYACKEFTRCEDVDNGYGYRCKCLDGYQGNPYLPNGCQDIDECNQENDCEKKCENIPGNYTCSCPKGYHGDGRKNGKGCTADQLLVIKIVLGTTISVTVLLVCFYLIYFGLRKRKLIMLKEKFFQQNGGFLLQQHLSRREGPNKTARIFSAEELERATDNYADSRIIGKGGYGTVYKGILVDNRTVAIKKSKVVDQTQIEQFINEVVVLSQINHRNVVKLLGCCLETQVPLLVYEYIANGTLFDHIHDESKASSMTFEVRLRIAAETAGVLSYLHSSASTPIIHRDVKPTNILLDDNYIAKVSDFGASRLVPLDQEQLSTIVQGTLGYLDPEYMHTSQLTEKSDVYSFGVVLVELLTGKKALCFNRPEGDRNLAVYFLSALKDNRLFDVVEDHIKHDQGNTDLLMELAKLAKRCLMVKGDERPTMKEVAMELEGLRVVEEHPWVNSANLISEETEYLLSESSFKNHDEHDNRGGSSSVTAAYDSIAKQVVFSIDDGR